MRSTDFILIEGRNHPVICVDVQPEYCVDNRICEKIINFVAVRQTGPVLMFVNAEDMGLTGDTIASVREYWEDTVREITNNYDNEQPIDWRRFQIVDKGYGYFRSWMDQGVSPAAIIRVIRAMYQHRISDSSEFEDIDPMLLPTLVGTEWDQWMYYDSITVYWTSVAQLKRFGGAYIVGGGRNECLREVELLMNAFNIRYKRINSLVY